MNVNEMKWKWMDENKEKTKGKTKNKSKNKQSKRDNQLGYKCIIYI